MAQVIYLLQAGLAAQGGGALARGRAGLRLECFNPQAFDFSLQRESPV